MKKFGTTAPKTVVGVNDLYGQDNSNPSHKREKTADEFFGEEGQVAEFDFTALLNQAQPPASRGTVTSTSETGVEEHGTSPPAAAAATPGLGSGAIGRTNTANSMSPSSISLPPPAPRSVSQSSNNSNGANGKRAPTGEEVEKYIFMIQSGAKRDTVVASMEKDGLDVVDTFAAITFASIPAKNTNSSASPKLGSAAVPRPSKVPQKTTSSSDAYNDAAKKEIAMETFFSKPQGNKAVDVLNSAFASGYDDGETFDRPTPLLAAAEEKMIQKMAEAIPSEAIAPAQSRGKGSSWFASSSKSSPTPTTTKTTQVSSQPSKKETTNSPSKKDAAQIKVPKDFSPVGFTHMFGGKGGGGDDDEFGFDNPLNKD